MILHSKNDKWVILNKIIVSFRTEILHLNLKEIVEKMMVMFTAHLSITTKRLTRQKQKLDLATMLEGKSMPSNVVANTNHTTFLKNQSAIKYLP